MSEQENSPENKQETSVADTEATQTESVPPKKKKPIWIAIACAFAGVAVVVGGVLAITNSAGTNESSGVHTHDWRASQTFTEATCVNDGVVTYACDCGKKQTQLVKAAGHQYGEWLTTQEENCVTDGEQKQVCSVCGDEQTQTLPAWGHDYVAISEATANGVLETTYQCEVCEEFYVLQGEKALSDIKKEEYLFGCNPDFTFKIVCAQDEAYIRQNLTLVDAYYTEQTGLDYTVTSQGDGVWIIAATTAYESGNTYTAIANGDVSFFEYDAKKLTFKIAQTEKEKIEVKEGIVFLKTLETQSPGYYPYETTYSEESNLAWLSVQKADGLAVGDILCVGEAQSETDLFTLSVADNESILGKIESIYQMESGSYLIGLSCPDLSEIFSTLEVYQIETLNFEDADFELSKDVQAQTVNALYASQGFAKFLTSVSLGSQSYLTARGLDATVASEGSLSDRLKIDPDFDIEGTTLKGLLSGSLTIPVQTKDGKISFGDITITFKAEVSFGIDFDYTLHVNRSLETKFEFSITQTDEFGFEFDVVVDVDYSQENVEMGEYVYNFKTLEIHNAKCKHVDQIKDKSLIVMITAEEAVEYLQSDKGLECNTCNPIYALSAQSYVLNTSTKTVHQYVCPRVKTMKASNMQVTNLGIDELKKTWELCGDCHPEQREAADFKARLANSMQYEKYEETLNKVGEKLQNTIKGEPLEKGIKLGHVDFRISLLQINFDLYFVLDFQFDATVDLDYRIRHENTYGFGLYDGRVRTWDTKEKEILKESLEVVGEFYAEAGLRLELYGSLPHLEEWGRLGVYVEGGLYTEAKGILHVDNVEGEGYFGAYLETGIYAEAGITYKLIKWGGNRQLGDTQKYPLSILGVDKVYYAYADTVGSVLTPTDHTFTESDLLTVTYYDLRREKSLTETLTFEGVDGVYTVNLRLKDGTYCHLDGNTLVIHENAPNTFTDTLYVSVEGVKGWGKYFSNNASFILGEYAVAIEYDSDSHAWQEVDSLAPSCSEFGWIDYVCADCGKEKREMVDKIDHIFKNGFCEVCSTKEPAYGLEYEFYDTYCVVTGSGMCVDTDLIIPDKYQGLPVREIVKSAFEYCTWLEWVTLPDRATLPSLHPQNNYSTL